MAESNAAESTSEQGKRRGDRRLKKIKSQVAVLAAKIKEEKREGQVRLMFQDEAGFGRINKPKYCWCMKGLRPHVPCHHIREFRYAYGAVEPMTGESFFLIMPYCNTDCMELFLNKLSETYPKDEILLVCDGASWHKANDLEIPDNIHVIFIPPSTPEMNPIEQIWKEIRTKGFKNEVFVSLADVVERLCFTIKNLSTNTIHHITARKWIVSCFN